jgi:periplasmic copper chaperone A
MTARLLLLAAAVVVAAQGVSGVSQLALYLTPLFLITALLLSGRYVAEERIVRRWRGARRRTRPVRGGWRALAEAPVVSLLERSPRLVRGPPASDSERAAAPGALRSSPTQPRPRRHAMRKRTIGAALTAAFAVPAAAQAHVTASPATLPAEGYAKVDLSVPHGCEDSPTTSLRVQMPPEVQSATPQVVPGWQIAVKEGKLPKPYDNHGEQVTEGVREITWSGGRLDAHQLEVFGISIKISGKPGDSIPFKAIQKCAKGETAWIEIPVEGEEEPPEPAPMVELVEAEDEEAATAPVPLQNTAATTDASDDGASTTLVVVALVVGALGLIAGIAGLATARRRPT